MYNILRFISLLASIFQFVVLLSTVLKLCFCVQALDEKQSEVITAASNELARRKGDLEVNLDLLNQLKVNTRLDN